MIKKSNKSHSLDPFHKKMEQSKALTLWMYNFAVEQNIISRPVGSPTHKERYAQVSPLLNKVRLDSGIDQQEYEGAFFEGANRAELEALGDADINWVDNLRGAELFASWYFVRNAIVENNFTPHTNEPPAALVGPQSLVSKVLEDNSYPLNGPYERLGLELSPQTEKDMKSCVLDFVSSWNSCIASKRKALRQIKAGADTVKAGNNFQFASGYSVEEIEQLNRH